MNTVYTDREVVGQRGEELYHQHIRQQVETEANIGKQFGSVKLSHAAAALNLGMVPEDHQNPPHQ